jgi:hypothetical protein
VEDIVKQSVLAAGIVVFVGSVSAGGCGGGSGDGNPAACGLAPCGGPVEGTWLFSDTCVDQELLTAGFAQSMADLMASCPGARFDNFNFDPLGSVVFNSDATYSLTLGIDISFQILVPSSCIQPATCTDLQVELAAALTADGTYRSVICTSGSTCVCTALGGTPTATEVGTYATSGTSVALTSADGTDTLEYCVAGTTMTLPLPIPDPTNPLTALIAQRQ